MKLFLLTKSEIELYCDISAGFVLNYISQIFIKDIFFLTYIFVRSIFSLIRQRFARPSINKFCKGWPKYTD